jgi:hypothetical protein
MFFFVIYLHLLIITGVTRGISLNDMHPKVAQLEENKSQYEDFIKEREEFFKKKYPELF